MCFRRDTTYIGSHTTLFVDRPERQTYVKLTSVKFLIDLVAWTSVTLFAFILRLETGWTSYLNEILLLLVVGVPIKAALLWKFGLHRRSWSKFGIRDLFVLVQVMAIMVLFMTAVSFFVSAVYVPRSIPVIEGVLGLLYLGMIRLTARLFFERSILRETVRNGRPRKVLIAGAGEAGTMLAREMVRRPDSKLIPVGYLDDDLTKQRKRFYAIPVLGTIDDLPDIARKFEAEEVLIAMPSEGSSVMRRVLDRANKAGLPHRTIPGIYDILNGSVNISQLREVAIEDLLGRQPVTLNTEEISGYLQSRTVLVTGAGGSIGSEIVRQVSKFNPSRIVLLGRGENSIFHIDAEMRREYQEIDCIPIIADVRDRESLEAVFRRYRPDVVFHAAAHKHVPLMEANPAQAIYNNIGGTRNVVELALQYKTARLVNVSTDKAVNPTSIMGASKRVAEEIVASGSRRAAHGQQFVSVRFGNVLGSRGSVIPFFKEQIRRGGPITVTHAEMTRYFMTIPEASQLVLQAGGLGENGSVFVLDMGEPVRIMDLATDLIRLSGLEPGHDIEIKVTGMRPGEKLFEEILTAEEGTEASRHEKIYRARCRPVDDDLLHEQIESLFEAAERRSNDAIRTALASMIPVHMLEREETDAAASVEVLGDGASNCIEIENIKVDVNVEAVIQNGAARSRNGSATPYRDAQA